MKSLGFELFSIATSTCKLLLMTLDQQEHCLQSAFDREVELFFSGFLIEEIQRTATDPLLRAKFRQLTDERITAMLINLERTSSFIIDVPKRFTYERDPHDAHYVNLAIATDAKYLVSRDKDLLQLSSDEQFMAQFPSLRFVTPPDFLRIMRDRKSSSGR